jgi:hypothetical protein
LFVLKLSVVKTQPKAPGSDFGFKVVKKKGKKN